MSSTIERKLAAIMFTDIVGYTEQMSKSEAKTLDLLEKKRSILNPLLKKYRGTFVKEIGDGTLTYFDSAIKAASCAVKLQETTYDDKDMNIRVGIHIGDIVFKDGDVFGDGVNVASRLESIAPSGGVCVSKNVYDELINQDEFDGIGLGLQSLKGVGRLVEVFGLKGEKLTPPNPDKYQDNKIDKHSDDEVPSVAIIPFDNKGSEEDVFYAYGISADLISDVSSAGLIRVPSLKRVEEVTDLSLNEKATKLGVRYTVEGTLWKMDDMFQLSIELYDTKEKKLIWSDRWQEKWDQLPSIKDSLSDGLLKALDTKTIILNKTENNNPQAYELYLRGIHNFEKRKNMEDINISRGLLEKSIDLDNSFHLSKIALGRTYFSTGDYNKSLDILIPAMREIEGSNDIKNSASIFLLIGYVYLYHKSNYDDAEKYMIKALEMRKQAGDKSGVASCYYALGDIYRHYDNKKALESIEHSMKIKEELGDEQRDILYMGVGSIYHNMYDLDKAIDYYYRAHKCAEKYGEKSKILHYFHNSAVVYEDKGDYDKALKNYFKTCQIVEQLGDKYRMRLSYFCIGKVYYLENNYSKSLEYLEKSLSMQEESGITGLELETNIYLFLTYKHLNKDYHEKEILTLIKETENIAFELNFKLYELLEDKSYLETAYKQVQEKASAMDDKLKIKFLSYPIPKAIIEEYNKALKK